MKTVTDILIDLLTPDQIKKAMLSMEQNAQQKYFNVQSYYEKNILDDDLTHAEDFEQMFNDTKWQNFLPLEYQKIKMKLESPLKQAS